jgi:hypothetical protein
VEHVAAMMRRRKIEIPPRSRTMREIQLNQDYIYNTNEECKIFAEILLGATQLFDLLLTTVEHAENMGDTVVSLSDLGL